MMATRFGLAVFAMRKSMPNGAANCSAESHSNTSPAATRPGRKDGALHEHPAGLLRGMVIQRHDIGARLSEERAGRRHQRRPVGAAQQSSPMSFDRKCRAPVRILTNSGAMEVDIDSGDRRLNLTVIAVVAVPTSHTQSSGEGALLNCRTPIPRRGRRAAGCRTNRSNLVAGGANYPQRGNSRARSLQLEVPVVDLEHGCRVGGCYGRWTSFGRLLGAGAAGAGFTGVAVRTTHAAPPSAVAAGAARCRGAAVTTGVAAGAAITAITAAAGHTAGAAGAAGAACGTPASAIRVAAVPAAAAGAAAESRRSRRRRQ